MSGFLISTHHSIQPPIPIQPPQKHVFGIFRRKKKYMKIFALINVGLGLANIIWALTSKNWHSALGWGCQIILSLQIGLA